MRSKNKCALAADACAARTISNWVVASALIGLALNTTAPAFAAPAGTYSGTLACEATSSGPPQPSFIDPVMLHVEGPKLTWSRSTTGTREVVTATLVDDRVAIDGYGGNVSAGTRQAFWDWKLAGELKYANAGFAGDLQILSKDGRAVQRQCRFATVSGPPSTATTGLFPASPALNADALSTTSRSGNLNSDRATDLQRREEALAARERALAEREQGRIGQTSTPTTPSRNLIELSPGTVIAPPATADTGAAAARAATAFGSVAGQMQLRKQGINVGAIPAPMGNSLQSALALDAGPMQALPSRWSTKNSFLGAVRDGQFLNVAKVTDSSPDADVFVNQISGLLGSAYQVPGLPRQAQGCTLQYATNVIQIFRAITQREASSLTNVPPTFRQPGRSSGSTPEDLIRRVQLSPNCDLEAMGLRQPHPYKQALIQLSSDYARATQDFVQAEAERRSIAFAQQQAEVAAQEEQKQALAERQAAAARDLSARQDAALRAFEQRRIDSERARIQAEEQRRQEIQRSRVGG